MGSGSLPTPTSPLVQLAGFVCRRNAGDRGVCVGGPSLGVCRKPALGLNVETLFWRFWGESGGPDWVVVFEVDDVVEGSECLCDVTEGEEGGFWKSLRMSTLIGFSVGFDEGAGA